MNKKLILLLFAGFGVPFFLFGCATTINNVQMDELVRYRSRNEDIKIKDSTTATLLGLLPGGASFYTGNLGSGFWSLLVWPYSILWEVPSGKGAAEYRNWEETIINSRRVSDWRYGNETKDVNAKRIAAGTEKTARNTNIAVTDFSGQNVSAADASIVAGFLRTELVNTRVFNVMDRANMEMILAEQKIQITGCTTEECAVKMGKLLNVQQMIVGSLSKLLDTYYITANLVDVETGKILRSEKVKAFSSGELSDGCRVLAEKLSQ